MTITPTADRFEAVLDVVQANADHGASRDWTSASLYDLVGPFATTETLVLIDRALAIVFDGVCQTCIEHPGWKTGALDQRRDPADICGDCLGSGRDQSKPRDDNDRVITGPPEPEPIELDHIDPVEEWASIVAIATTGLSALAREAEGTHRDAVERLREHADRLHTLVTNW